MTIEETKLELAVDVAARALRATPAAPLEMRVDIFRQAYAAVAALDSGVEDADWSAETLKAAWGLAAEAFPKGGTIAEVIDALSNVHAAVVATAAIPPNLKRKAPRRGHLV